VKKIRIKEREGEREGDKDKDSTKNSLNDQPQRKTIKYVNKILNILIGLFNIF
jgi:hypothetical protein